PIDPQICLKHPSSGIYTGGIADEYSARLEIAQSMGAGPMAKTNVLPNIDEYLRERLMPAEGTMPQYRRALEINPNSAQAQLGYTSYLSTVGRHDEAIPHAEIVNRVDPLALDSRNEALWAYYFSGPLQETIEQARKAIELEPDAGLPYAMLALAAADLGQRDEAARAAEKAAQSAESTRNNVCATNCSPTVLATAASALARAGQHDRAKQVLERTLVLAKTRY